MKYIGMCGHPRFKEERRASAWCTLINKKKQSFSDIHPVNFSDTEQATCNASVRPFDQG
jgi:hypothetical protein